MHGQLRVARSISIMAGLLRELIDDLTVETNVLLAVLESLDAPSWETPTLCTPWTVKDQISHLAWNDDATVRALCQPEAFLADKPTTLDGIQHMVNAVIDDHHHLAGEELLAWFRKARGELLHAFADRDPKARMPWYGPEMSVVSKLTARFMETWAHSHDVHEAFFLTPAPSDRARHVAFLGLQAIPNTFATHGRPVPVDPVRLVLMAPSGIEMHFGRPEATNIVSGELQELALVVTQRRHVADTTLAASGPVAQEWLSIAQAFAGPPGDGRPATRKPTKS